MIECGVCFLFKASDDEARDNFFYCRIGLEWRIIDIHVVEILHGCSVELVKCCVVLIDDEIGLCHHGGTIFKIDKPVRSFEMKRDLLGIEQVKHRNVVLAEAKVLEGVSQFIGFHEKIRENHNKRTLLDLLGDRVKCLDKACFPFGFDRLKRFKNVLQLGRATAWRDLQMEFFVTTRETHGISLVDDEITQGGGNA